MMAKPSAVVLLPYSMAAKYSNGLVFAFAQSLRGNVAGIEMALAMRWQL
jgi:hypothetical protein